MTDIKPMPMQWSGEGFYPLHPKLADRQYVVGQVYSMAPYEERSTATHNHEFAWLHEAWLNLPERMAELYPTPEHLRKRALIEAGYYDETVVDAGSNAAALRVATAFRGIDDFAVVIVRGPLVLRRTAKSQSRRAMDKAEFAKSKAAIMEVVAAMIGITPAALHRERAA